MPNKLLKLIDGKFLSEKILLDVHKDILKLRHAPGLAAILVGDDPASELYIKLKKKACEKCDIHFHVYKLGSHSTEQEIIDSINFLNNDDDTDGIMVQLPLPKKFNTDKIISAIDPSKDIDGFHPINRAKMEKGACNIMPPMPGAVVELVKATDEVIKNKNITVLCNNKIVALPFECVWGKQNNLSVVTLEDKSWKDKTKNADILIVGVGKAKFIKASMVKKDAIIIDIGINKVKEQTVGDVDLKNVLPKIKFISPVPGGVGPMTVAMLLKNLLKLAKQNEQ